jgi:hypothetical protein
VTVFYPGFARAVGSDTLDLGAIVAHNRFRWIVFEGPEAATGHLAIARQYGSGSLVAIDAAADPNCERQEYPAADAVLAASNEQRMTLARRFPQTPVRVFGASPPESNLPSSGLWPRLRRAIVGRSTPALDDAIVLNDLEREVEAARHG